MAARLNRGHWYYQLRLGDAMGLHGPRTRWYPASHFSESELTSFAPLRDAVATAGVVAPVYTPDDPYRYLSANARKDRSSQPRARLLTRKPRMKRYGHPYGAEPPPKSYSIKVPSGKRR